MSQVITLSNNDDFPEIDQNLDENVQSITVTELDRVQVVPVTQTNDIQNFSVTQQERIQSFGVSNDVTFMQGAPGKPGQPGFSPIIHIEDVEGGHNVIVTDVEGEKRFFVPDGDTADIDLSPYALKTDIPEVPTKVSELQNDSGYLTEVPEVDLSPYALKTDIPEIPEVDLSPYALKTEVPTVPENVSAFNNDAGYLTEFTETDPTVPAWAKAETKPTYTAAEVGADIFGAADNALASANKYTDQQIAAIPTPDVSGQIGTHNTATDAHNDIRLFIQDLTARVNALADSDDDTLDQMSEIVAYIKANRELVEQVTNVKVSVSDIIDNLTTNVSNRPLSAAQGVVIKALIDAITVPTKVSELTNDAGYLTELPEHEHSQYLTEHQSLDAYALKSQIPIVPTKVSAFENDKGYLTQHQSLEAYALKSQIPTVPTKVSAFTNDSEYATKSEVTSLASRVIVADTHVRQFTTANLEEYAKPGHVEHWSSVTNRNDYKTGDICLLKAYNTSNNNQKVYIITVALYPTSGGGVQGLSLGYAPVEWS